MDPLSRSTEHDHPSRVQCGTCGDDIEAEELNVYKRVAWCRRCDAYFSIEGRDLGEGPLSPTRRAPAPPGLRVESGEPLPTVTSSYRTAPRSDLAPLVIRRRWLGFDAVYWCIGCLVWNALVLFWWNSTRSEAEVPLLTKVLIVAYLAAGAGILYLTLTRFLNSTVIRVGDGMLTVREGPLPLWPTSSTIPTAPIRQLSVRCSTRYNKGVTHTTWQLHADTGEEAPVVLLWAWEHRKQVEYIEWAIERHLGIEDETLRDAHIRRPAQFST